MMLENSRIPTAVDICTEHCDLTLQLQGSRKGKGKERAYLYFLFVPPTPTNSQTPEQTLLVLY